MNEPHRILARIHLALQHATQDRGTPFTLLSLATIGSDGGPRARSVILRAFVTDPPTLFFATNAASTKVTEIRDHPQVAGTMYDRHRQVQLRIVGRATTIVDEGQRRRAWDALPSHSRKVFEVDSAPGDQLTAYDQFAWIRIELHELEWLDLSTQPHERWRLLRGGQGWITERMG